MSMSSLVLRIGIRGLWSTASSQFFIPAEPGSYVGRLPACVTAAWPVCLAFTMFLAQ